MYRKPAEPFTTARARLAIEIGLSVGTLIRASAKRPSIRRGNAAAISAATIGDDGKPMVTVEELLAGAAREEAGDDEASDVPACAAATGEAAR